jgi:hypothetical protein
MTTINYKETELQRNLKLVAKSVNPLPNNTVNKALGILNKVGQKYLKLRSDIKGSGYVSGNSLELVLTIPLDVRYEKRNAENADTFNNAWASEFRDKFGMVSGGYVSLEPTY